MKLSNKLTGLFILLSILPMAIVGYLAFENGRRAIEEELTNHLLSTTILKEAELDLWIQGNARQLRELAGRGVIQQYTTALALPEAKDPVILAKYHDLIDERLQLSLEEELGFLDLSILHASNGQILVSSSDTLEGKYREQMEFFQKGREGTFIDDMIYDLSSEDVVLHISTPIDDQPGHVVAVLAGHVDLSELSEIMSRQTGLSASEETYLVNKFNFFVTESRFESGYALTKSLFTAGVVDCLTHNNGVAHYENYLGVPVIGAYRWIPERELCILTEISQSEAFAPSDNLGRIILTLGLLIAVSAAALGSIFARSLTRPIRLLVKGTQTIGRGDLDYRIEPETKDEIGELTLAFNEMVRNLRAVSASRDELDKEVTDRKQAQEELIKERDKVQQYLDVAGTIFVVIDADQKVGLINKAGCEMLGAEEGKIVGQNWFENFIPETNRREIHVVYKLLMAGEMEPTEYYENPVLTKDGSERMIAWHNTLLVDEEGKIQGTLSSGEDITGRKEAEREIQRLNEELEERVLQRTAQLKAANEELEAFTYSVSHDLRSPLRAIDGFSRILMDEYLPDLSTEAQHYLGLVRENTLDMAKLIDDLLAFSRLGRQELVKQRVSPNELIKRALEHLESVMEGRALELTTADLPDCQADPVLLMDVYTNLLDNALKFTRDRDPAMIDIGYLELEGEQVYFVKDNGVGFDMQYANKLFGVFQRLHRAEQFEGTGVGLANVQRIIHRHGGRVWAEAELGKGATFYFTLRGEAQDES